MGFGNNIYAPTIQIGDSYYPLPQPFRQTTEEYQARVAVTKVPLRNGALVSSSVLDAMTVSFDGIIVGVGATWDAKKDSVVDIKQELISRLINTSTTFNLYRYYDPRNSKYRWYENCECTSLTFNNSVDTVMFLPYSFSIIVPDGREMSNMD